ncbi:membrane hypothetical protein [Candidatus Sulfobium mesophilum]|uniref:O-antigen ligase-related domain-containing protein n=1 Tax=Candidatus Sulfobium mesophilum TaxID=2016548 RepID=A0A2U3QJG8_9BACT|nr:membrane hypothetical protein [Candidatus Sulfobium mesophilum]
MISGYAGMFFFSTIAHSPVEICGAIVLAAWILSGRFVKETEAWLASPLALPVIGMSLFPWLGLLYTKAPADGLGIAASGYHWLYCIPLAGILRERKQGDLFIKLFLAGLFINTLLSFLQIAHIFPLRYGTPSGFLGISSAWITYTLLLTSGICITSFYFRHAGSRKLRLGYGLLMLLYFLTIGFVGGRSGYVAFILLSPLLVYNLVGGRHLVRIVILSTLAIFVLFTFPVVQGRFAQVRKDLLLYAQGDVNTSLGLRLRMWAIALNEIKSHPVAGIGTNSFKDSWEKNKQDRSLPFFDHPHNSFLYMLVSFGIPGLIVFCWLLFVMLKKGWGSFGSPLGFSLFVFTLIFITGSLTDTQLIVFPTTILFILFSGIAASFEDTEAVRKKTALRGAA